MGEKMKDHCDSSEKLSDFLRKKARHHYRYKFYSYSERVEKLLNTGHLYLSSGSKWNDMDDRDKFNPANSENVRFGKCFSFSRSENVAMWMLYGGTQKKGMMVDFSQKIISNILETKSVRIGRFKNDAFFGIELQPDQFTVDICDVIYFCEEDNGYFTIKRSDERCEKNEKKILDNNIAKRYPWNYENETRLIVTVPKKYVPADATDLEIILSEEDRKALKKRTYHAPNWDGEKEYENSTMQDMIEWDLCNNCKK